MQTGKLVIGILAGATVGAAIGMLFAPRSGAELRKDIADKGGNAFKDVKDKVVGLKEKVADLAHKAEDKVLDLVDKGKAKLDEGIAKLESKKGKGDVA